MKKAGRTHARMHQQFCQKSIFPPLLAFFLCAVLSGVSQSNSRLGKNPKKPAARTGKPLPKNPKKVEIFELGWFYRHFCRSAYKTKLIQRFLKRCAKNVTKPVVFGVF